MNLCDQIVAQSIEIETLRQRGESLGKQLLSVNRELMDASKKLNVEVGQLIDEQLEIRDDINRKRQRLQERFHPTNGNESIPETSDGEDDSDDEDTFTIENKLFKVVRKKRKESTPSNDKGTQTPSNFNDPEELIH